MALAVTVPLLQSIASEAGLRSVVNNLGTQAYVTIEQFNVCFNGPTRPFRAPAGRTTP